MLKLNMIYVYTYIFIILYILFLATAFLAVFIRP